MVGSVIWRQTLGDLLRRTAARMPQKTAIRCGTVAWTYAQFERLCNQLAAGLTAQGIRTGNPVAILARNSHAFAAVRFAVARIGAVLVPINFMLKAEEVAHILRHSGARFLCVDSELASVGREAALLDTSVERLAWLPSEEPTTAPPGLLRFDDLLVESAAAPTPDLDGSIEPAAPAREAPDHFILRAAYGVDRAAALTALRAQRPEPLAQGVLRRLDHAHRGAA
jgi:fatty-acyl-CoA synthase